MFRFSKLYGRMTLMKNLFVASLILLLFTVCVPVGAQKPSTPAPAPKPVNVPLTVEGPDNITLSRADTLELSLSLAEITIAEKELAILRLQSRELERKLVETRDAVSNARTAYTEKAKAKFIAAGIPADQLEKYSGTQDSSGRLVMKRTPTTK